MQEEIEGYARGYGLDFFPIIYEVLDYKTMNEVAAYGGFPTRYPHWRFGMDYEQLSKGYEWGLSKIYEMVINTNPSYAYLLEGNSTSIRRWSWRTSTATSTSSRTTTGSRKTNRKMIDGMANHAARVRRHMERCGQDAVEDFIDTCLSLENLIDPMSPYIARRAATQAARRGRRRAERACRPAHAPRATWTSSSTRPSPRGAEEEEGRREARSRSAGSPSSRSATCCSS